MEISGENGTKKSGKKVLFSEKNILVGKKHFVQNSVVRAALPQFFVFSPISNLFSPISNLCSNSVEPPPVRGRDYVRFDVEKAYFFS